nr:P1 family peptidase [Pseudomonas sp. Marseille-P9899]
MAYDLLRTLAPPHRFSGFPLMPLPGPRNALTDIPGLTVGHATDPRVDTGVTVIRTDSVWTASVDIRGGGEGGRRRHWSQKTWSASCTRWCSPAARCSASAPPMRWRRRCPSKASACT